MKNLIYWIPIFGIALPSCKMENFKNPAIYGWYQFICCMFALTLLMGSCMSKADEERMRKEQAERKANKQQPIVHFNDTPLGITVQEVDGCQYIYAETRHGVAICHKANCNNPIH